MLVGSLVEWALKCPIDLSDVIARHICHTKTYSLLKIVAELIVVIISAVLTDIDFALATVSWISCWLTNVFMVWHLTTWPVSVCALQQSTVVLGCDHRMTINCSSNEHVLLALVCVLSTPLDQQPGTLYLLRFVIQQTHWEPLGRCWNHLCFDWQKCRPQYSCRGRCLCDVWNACYYYYHYQSDAQNNLRHSDCSDRNGAVLL